MSRNLHTLRIFSGNANPALAEEISLHLNRPLGRSMARHLPDSEIHITIDELVRDDDIFIIQPCSQPVNDNLMELILYIDAFRRASAHRINVVIPYFPYARQERMARGREAISARVVATMLETIGATRVIYVDIHAEATQGFFTIPVDPLSAMTVFAEHIDAMALTNPVIVAPDVGRAKLASRFSRLLDLPLVIMHKRRTSFSSTETTAIVGDIKDKTPIVFDDLIAGGSVLTQVESLVEAGARPEVIMAITHAVLLPSALERLNAPYIKKLLVTNTIAIPPEKQHPKLETLSIAPILAEAIFRIHSDESMSPLMKHQG
ncbi:MAG: ribose-phosphate pyrophosphokinase [Clostridia bacterium]|nr:MAG: ribose-phosphate pyrophosphokinase [Clostridia bacterium]